MAEGPEYPKCMYRDGGADLVWGEPIETRIVASAEEEREALARGWRLHPLPSDDEPLRAETIDAEPKPRRGRPPKDKVTA